ncbi:MAG: hypothetical protein H6816_08270 [Phycisphaerales bacterium]|nr:hypothetical protein [Phycisphaerales bacterium]
MLDDRTELTTPITAIILGHVGSEGGEGFAMTLGLASISMFTALFVNRVMPMSLIEWGVAGRCRCCT